MSPAERAFWNRAQRRAADMSTDVARAYLQGLSALRERLVMVEIERLVNAGDVEAVVRMVANDAAFARAFAQYTKTVRAGVESATNASIKTIAGRVGGPPRTRTPARVGFPSPPDSRHSIEVGFDILNPKVIDAVRKMETRSLGTIQDEVRDTVRAHIENGIRDGVGPRTTARELREVIGLAPNQEEAVRNFNRALAEGDFTKALGYELRDRRSDGVLERLRKEDGTLSAGQVESMTARYRKNFIAWNAETHARTASLEAQRIGQRLSWLQSKEAGIFGGRRIFKKWRHLAGQENPRAHHEQMDGIEVEIEEPYPNGDMYAGEGDPWNCHCVDLYRVELLRAS